MIIRDGTVIWLGDIAKLPESEQYYLRSENRDSDHSIGSEFYDGEIECIFTEPNRENRLFAERSDFVEACFLRFGAKIAHLDSEVMDLSIGFNSPVVDTEKERRHIADSLNKIYVESLHRDALGKILAALGGDAKDLGSLKRLQKIIEYFAPAEVAASLISPFFVLYDLRVAYSHLTSAASAADIMAKVLERLALPNGSGLQPIYDALVERLGRTRFVILA